MRRCVGLTLLIAGLAVLLTGCQQEEGLYTGNLIMEGNHQLANGERLMGAVFILDGALVISEGAQVDGPVFMLGGRLESHGEILSEVSVLGGSLILGPTAVVGGDLNLSGGELERSPQAVISGEVSTGVQVPARPPLFYESLRDQWRPFLVEALLLGVLAYILVRYLPRPVRRVSGAATHHPLVSLAMGLLVGIVAVSLLVLMAFTIILIPVSIFFGFVMLLAVLLGWISLGKGLGGLLVKLIRRNLKPPVAAAIGTVIFVFVLNVLSLVPTVGGIIPILLICTGLGAVFLTRFGLVEFSPVEDTAEGEF